MASRQEAFDQASNDFGQFRSSTLYGTDSSVDVVDGLSRFSLFDGRAGSIRGNQILNRTYHTDNYTFTSSCEDNLDVDFNFNDDDDDDADADEFDEVELLVIDQDEKYLSEAYAEEEEECDHSVRQDDKPYQAAAAKPVNTIGKTSLIST